MAEPKRYRVLAGLNYPDPARKGQELRAEPGDVVGDLPAKSVRWLLEAGVIEDEFDALDVVDTSKVSYAPSGGEG